MNNLSNSGSDEHTPPSSGRESGMVGSMAKEAGPVGAIGLEHMPLTEVGEDITLRKEVSAAGVEITPTDVSIHPDIMKLGVTPQGFHVPDAVPKRPPGMLSDDELAQGFREPITSSFHWLSMFWKRVWKQWVLRNHNRDIPVTT